MADAKVEGAPIPAQAAAGPEFVAGSAGCCTFFPTTEVVWLHFKMRKPRLREGRDCVSHSLQTGHENLDSGAASSQAPTTGAQGSLGGGGGRTHSAGHRPEGGEPLRGVGGAAAPGSPARVLAPLQHVLLPLETGVLKAHPPADRG